MFFGFFTELVLMIGLSYIKVFNLVFGTRDVLFIHFGIGSIPFALLMIIWNEGRKYMVIRLLFRFETRRGPERCRVGGQDAWLCDSMIVTQCSQTQFDLYNIYEDSLWTLLGGGLRLL